MKIKTLSKEVSSVTDDIASTLELTELESEVLSSIDGTAPMQKHIATLDYATEIKNIVSSTEAERAHQTIMELNSMGVLRRVGLKIEDTGEQADYSTLQQIEIHCEGIISGIFNFIKNIITAIIDAIMKFFKWIGRLLGFNPSSGGSGGGGGGGGGSVGKSKVGSKTKEIAGTVDKHLLAVGQDDEEQLPPIVPPAPPPISGEGFIMSSKDVTIRGNGFTMTHESMVPKLSLESSSHVGDWMDAYKHPIYESKPNMSREEAIDAMNQLWVGFMEYWDNRIIEKGGSNSRVMYFPPSKTEEIVGIYNEFLNGFKVSMMDVFKHDTMASPADLRWVPDGSSTLSPYGVDVPSPDISDKFLEYFESDSGGIVDYYRRYDAARNMFKDCATVLNSNVRALDMTNRVLAEIESVLSMANKLSQNESGNVDAKVKAELIKGCQWWMKNCRMLSDIYCASLVTLREYYNQYDVYLKCRKYCKEIAYER